MPPWSRPRRSLLLVCTGAGRRGALVKAESVTDRLEFSSVLRSKTGFCQDKCWHIPQQKRSGSTGEVRGGKERETKRQLFILFSTVLVL